MTHFPSSPADSLATSSSVRICKEVFEDGYKPSKDEINDYAKKIGIDVDKEAHLLHIALEGLMKALPEEWKPCFSEKYQSYYYYNVKTKQSQWIHPQDAIFKQKVQEARTRLADTTSEEVDSGIRSADMDGGVIATAAAAGSASGGGAVRMMEKRLGGKFLAPLTVGRTPPPQGSGGGGSELKSIGRVDQIRRQFDVQKVLEADAKKPAVKGFTLTGTGSMFLKSSSAGGVVNKKATTDDSVSQPKSLINSETAAAPPPPHSVKGILRDSSLTDVHTRHRNSESGELEKSVRFSLFGPSTSIDNNADEMPISAAAANPIPRPSSALNKNLKMDQSESDDTSTDDDFGDEEEEDEQVIEEVAADDDNEEDAWTPRRPCEIKVITSSKHPATTGAEMKNQAVDLLQEQANQVERRKSLLEYESNRFDAEIKRIRTINEDKLQQFAAEEERKLQALLEAKSEEMEIEKQSSLTIIESQLEAKLQSVRAEIEESYSLDTFRNELLQDFEMKRRTIVDEHRASVELLERNHQEIIEDLERDLKLQEDLIRKEHSTKKAELRSDLTHEIETERIKMRESGDDRMYEKMRCEKRLLEDKYRCLKDRYNRLKTDVKLSVEKRNSRRREQQQQLMAESDKRMDLSSDRHRTLEKKNSSTGEKQMAHHRPNIHPHTTEDTTSISISDNTISHTHPRMNYSAPLGVDDSDSEALFLKSENQRHSIPNNHNHQKPLHTQQHGQNESRPDQQEHSPRDRKKLYSRTKSASTSRLHSSKLAVDFGAVPCTPIENLRRQLKKLEDLEDQFPDNTLEATYHLRYPFGLDTATTNYENTSSELEFFKHRIHLERDALSRAKANLKSQRDNFRAKREKILHPHCTVDELMGDEKELTEMEVNLHRTRALLGEKVIRLRHLEQSLQRFMEHKADPATLSDLSSHSSSGFSSTDFMLSGGDAANSNKNRRAPTGVESTTDILKNLETLNSEIREIWEILKQTTNTSSTANYYTSDLDWSFNANTPQHLPLTPNPLLQEHGSLLRSVAGGGVGGMNRNFTSLMAQSPMAGQYTSTLVERTRDLRNWLRQAKQEHLLAQKHTQI